MWILNVTISNSNDENAVLEKEYLIGCGSFIVGRIGSDIPFETDLSVSRKHATLNVSIEDGSLTILDHNSKFGTWINGKQILHNNPVPIKGEGEDVVKFGAQKSFIKFKKKEWQIFGFCKEFLKLVPKNGITIRLADADLIILGSKGLELVDDVESRLEFILAWSRGVPIVDEKFISNFPSSANIIDHLVPLPFTKVRLSNRSFRTDHPKGDKIITEFGGKVNQNFYIELSRLLDYLYFINDQLEVVEIKNNNPRLTITNEKANNVSSYSGPSRTFVSFSDSLLRMKQNRDEGRLQSNSERNFKKFKKSQPSRDTLPEIIELERATPKTVMKSEPAKENFPKIRERKTPNKIPIKAGNFEGKKARKSADFPLPIDGDSPTGESKQITPNGKNIENSAKKEEFKSDFFKGLT
jgi:hypothetical protein